MQFVKTIVDSIGCAGGDASIDNIEQYHYRIWKHFSLMPIEKLSKTEESPDKSRKIGASEFKSPKSLSLPSSYSTIGRNVLKTNCYEIFSYKKVYRPSSQQENVFLALHNYKSSLYQLEQCILSPVPDPDYEKIVNIDKVSGLLEKADLLIESFKEELVNKLPSVVAIKDQLDQLDGILKTLQTNSASIENATDALKSFSRILTDHLHECISLVDINELFLIFAKQLRLYWLVHFPNHHAGTTFESQLEQFIEALFTVLNHICPKYSKEVLPLTNVSLDVLTILFESLLPYLVVIKDKNEFNLNCNSVMRSRDLIHSFNTSLIAQYSSRSHSDSLQVRVVIALLRLLKKYSFQAMNKPVTDLPPLDFPAMYASALGKQFKTLNIFQTGITTSLFLSYTAIFLLEIYEIFEVYSGFKIYDNPLGLDGARQFFDVLLCSLAGSIWNFMGPLEHKMRSQNIDPTSLELRKYISKKYPKKEEKENGNSNFVSVPDTPIPSTSSVAVSLPPSEVESSLTTNIEQSHSPMTTDDDNKEDKEQEEVPMDSMSTPDAPSASLSLGTSISWLKSIKSSIQRRISRGEEEPENKKRKLFMPEVIDIDDSGPDTEPIPLVSSETGPSTSPNKKQKVSTVTLKNKSEPTKMHDVIDLECEHDAQTQRSTLMATPPSLASSAAEAVRQSSNQTSPLKSPTPSESEMLKMQLLKLQNEFSQMSNQFNRLLEKLNR